MHDEHDDDLTPPVEPRLVLEPDDFQVIEESGDDMEEGEELDDIETGDER